uniref:Alpha/beta hydrolase fold-3 domain-containing protein n=1 Tax=Chromera velia CCMP2878 TaxID=1169474 RepID=A0A0G4HE27_9ALVE|mmetsp:Transcript_55427/g.108504  ORF Transcript_55427/g.108504 Transcript_55427/m.108504 type:complete len:346 (+) Transcript_55427:134-1171(+)|eukprot:Cvel_979.t1-p1 / transcript=Cvel_979.t1 / gene=Cvel_979 / organism=Chromera_velia_CCMP2878 / gene_product=Carboxylesterase NlhH, putative / transcript_product=Carboxylesterase NlhH, putative / location=Cvel_scaffold31:154429-155463(-) / protein_length=345 / sequence_SO=supercontig / SO=protein_coding / is_pseudo=false
MEARKYVDPRLAAAFLERPEEDFGKEKFDVTTLEGARGCLAQSEDEIKKLFVNMKVDRQGTETEKVKEGQFEMFITSPPESVTPLGVVLVYIHGGGMGILSTDGCMYGQQRVDFAVRGFTVVGVQFRNSAGELGCHPFPAGLTDCVDAIRWVVKNRETKFEGAEKIILAGDSGGGNLTLASAMKLKRDGDIGAVAGLYCFCPFISGLYGPADAEEAEAVGLHSIKKFNELMRSPEWMGLFTFAYDPEKAHRKDPLAWPLWASVEELKGLPPCVLQMNEADPLRDEGLMMYRKMLEAGVDVRARVLTGTFHAAEVICKKVMPALYDSALDDVVSFAKSILGSKKEQ